MRVLLPALHVRAFVREELRRFFRTGDMTHFDTALHTFCGFYEIDEPTVQWYERLDDPKRAGECTPRGLIRILHPDIWKKNRVYNKPKRWLEVVLHELSHYYLWAGNVEAKADTMMEGWMT